MAALFAANALAAGELGEMPADWAAAKNWLAPWTDGKRVVIRDFRGNDLLELARVSLAFPCYDAAKDRYGQYNAKVKSAVQLDPQIVRVDYEIRKDDIREHYALIVSEGGPRLRIENRVVVKPGVAVGTVSPGAVCRNTILLKPVGECALGKAFCRGGVWRKPDRGESYEAGGATLVPYVVPEGELYLWYDSIGSFRRAPHNEPCLKYRSGDVAEALRDAKVTAENAKGAIMPATGEYYEQVHGKEVAKEETAAAADGEKAYSNVISVYYLPWKDAAFVASAMQTGAALAATVTTGRDFNLFDSSKETAAFDVTMMNPKNAAKEVKCRVVARNYDGRVDADEKFKVTLAPYGITSRHFVLPKRLRDYWFVNAEFDDGATNSFVRADVAALEPYKYKSLGTSVMGIAANFNIPSAEACDRLLTRMGARWIRSSGGTETEKYAEKDRRGILSFHLDHRATNEAQRIAFAKEKLKEAAARDCPIVEIGNELNFGAKGDEIRKRCEGYRDWLKAFHDARAELNLEKEVKISTFGFAGCIDGGTFYKAMDKAGCWDYCDVLSLHPGRLNQTPDNPGPDWQWNYRAQIQSTKGFMKSIREKHPLDLILTEVYARTPPNKNDSDSTRSAAENLILSCMLAKVEGATALNWYQMHDSVHSNVGGINEFNTEYHYGLLRRDGTVKPSLLAFCTISEALDGAEFDRSVSYEDDRRAWFFRTPRGSMAIIYDRKDGYYPYDGMFTGRPFAGHLEPWLDHWKSHTDYRFEAPKGFVVVRDAIGRTRKVKADANGRVTLKLSGAPLIVYGLGAPAPAVKPRPAADWGLVSAAGATAAEAAKFREIGGGFAFDAKLGEGFAEYDYFPLPESPRSATEAAAGMKALHAKGVRRLVVPVTVSPKGADWNAKKEDGRRQGLALAERLKPYAAAHGANPDSTPEVWVLPRGDRWAAMFNGVKKLADGVAFPWDSFPWARPMKRMGEIVGESKAFGLPSMVLDFGPVGNMVTDREKGRKAEIADAQFFTALLLLSAQPTCRAVAFTNLRDAAPGAASLGTTALASTITNKVGRYCTASGFFDANGGEKNRLKAAKFVRELTKNSSAAEVIVTQAGLRVFRFWDGSRRCAVVWQGNRNALTWGRIDDLSGRPEPTEAEVEVRVARKTKLQAFDIYGEERTVEVKDGKAVVKVAGDVPVVLCGVEDVAERRK